MLMFKIICFYIKQKLFFSLFSVLLYFYIIRKTLSIKVLLNKKKKPKKITITAVTNTLNNIKI